MFKIYRTGLLIAYSLIFLTIILINSCTSDEDNNIKILPDKMQEYAFSLDSIAEDLDIIPLTFSKPGSVSDIAWREPYFYISTSDGKQRDKVRIITRSGGQVNCLDRPGRGPGEYLSVYDFAVDSNQTIYVNTWHKIVVFDKHFKHLRDIRWPDDVDMAEMYMHDDHLYLFDMTYRNPVYDWIIYDSLGNIISTKNYNCYKQGPVPRRYDIFIFRQNDAFYRYRAIDDTIFSVYNTGWDPQYLINRKFQDGYRMFSQEELSSKLRIDHLWESLYQEHIRVIGGIWGLGGDLLITYDKQHNKRLRSETVLIKNIEGKMSAKLIYETDYSIRGKALGRGLPNDWTGYGSIKPMSVAVIDSVPHIVSYMDALSLKKMVQSDKFINSTPGRPEIKNKFIKVADTLDDNSDPVLLLLKLKQPD
ncbi:MAG: 6-bladed beta-propeller [Bacteroidales bacterium]